MLMTAYHMVGRIPVPNKIAQDELQAPYGRVADVRLVVVRPEPSCLDLIRPATSGLQARDADVSQQHEASGSEILYWEVQRALRRHIGLFRHPTRKPY